MGREKKRLLVTISYSFSIRYIYRSGLLTLLRNICEPVVCITWHQADLIDELRSDGFEVHMVPDNKKYPLYAGVRHKIDIWFKYYRLKSPSQKIQAQYLDAITPLKKKFIPNLRKLYNRFKFFFPFVVKKMLDDEKKLLYSQSNYAELEAFVESLDIDAVFTLTPFHRQEDILLRVCSNKKKRMLTSILSFDNITKRGWIPVEYDMYMVWNQDNKNQLHRIYPEVNIENCFVAGAAQFDFYFKEGYLLNREVWKQITGLYQTGSERKIILYAGGPKSLFPQEPGYLGDIDEAITNGEIEGNPVVLFRCHPIDNIDRWKKSLPNSKNILFDASWTGEKNMGETNITDFDIKKLCSTLCYTDVHINLCSTMTIDGSAFNKPQIGPAYYKNNGLISRRLYKMYWQEHFEPLMRTGGLMIAKSRQELIKHINKALASKPEDLKHQSKLMLESIITYADGRSTDRVYDLIKQHLQAG